MSYAKKYVRLSRTGFRHKKNHCPTAIFDTNARILFSNFLLEKFPHRSRIRGGVYFVEALPKTPTGKPIRREIAEIATGRFQSMKETDPDIKSYLMDIPEEFRKLI